MKQKAVRLLQSVLTEQNLYDGPIDGSRNPTLSASVNGVIAARSNELSGDPGGWSDLRKTTASFQLACKDKDIDPGPADGLWGTLTETAYFILGVFLETGSKPPTFRDIVPIRVNPNNWPTDGGNQSQLFDYFSFDPRNGGDPPMTTIRCPWTLKLDWDRSTTTTRIGCHPKVAESLERILVRAHEHYKDDIADLGLDIYGGCKNVRRKQNGSTWSIHSFAAALDFDPSNNKLDWGWRMAHFARPEFHDFWTFWEEEGWLSLGRERNFDWMHVQAVKLP